MTKSVLEYITGVLFISACLVGLFLLAGCDDDKRYVTTNTYNTTTSEVYTETHDNDTVTYEIRCPRGHKHRFADHCKKDKKD